MLTWQITLVSLFVFAVLPFGWLLMIGIWEAEKHSKDEARVWFAVWVLQIIVLTRITLMYIGA